VYVDKGITPEDDHLMAGTCWDVLVALFHRYKVTFFPDGLFILLIKSHLFLTINKTCFKMSA
jgi:hypothetical protein